MKEIVFGGGCFWGVEEFMSRIEGVLETEVGYANGNTENPTYEEVCTKDTGFAEVCFVKYDEEIISLSQLILKYFSVIDPTSLNKQGNDVGPQYRTGIYYLDDNDIEEIANTVHSLKKNYDKPIVVEIEPLKKYYTAEEYHQRYLKKNPFGYCHIKLD